MTDNQKSIEIKEKAIAACKTIFDPEIPVNIYDLGLIYDIQVTESNEVVVLMTVTTPNCPEAENLPPQVEFTLKEIPEVKDAKVIMTFDPPWDKSKLSDAAKLELGLF